MRKGVLFTGLVVLLMAGCSGGSGSQEASNTSSLTNSLASEKLAVAVESAMAVDLENRQVYLPATGWISEDAFWDIYYNEPQKLPGSLDFDALHQLGYRDAPAVTNNGDGA